MEPNLLQMTPEQLLAAQRAAFESLPTVPTKDVVEANLRREAAEEAQRAKEEAARKTEAARKVRLINHANAIIAVLEKLHPDRSFKWSENYRGISVNEDYAGYSYLPSIDIMLEEHGGNRYSYRSSYTGKTRITVGAYGERISYPQLKDGTHNYDKIAARASDALEAAEQRVRLQAKANRAKQSNATVVTQLRERIGLREYYGPMYVSASQTEDKPVFVEVKISAAMTVEQAEKLYAALKQADVL